MKKLDLKLAVIALLAGATGAQAQLTQPYLLPHYGAADGTPESVTGFSAAHQFRHSGLGTEGQSQEERDSSSASAGSEKEQRSSFEILPDYGSFSTKITKGDTYSLPLYANFKINDRIGLNVTLPVEYTEYRLPFGSLKTYSFSLNVGVPIKVLKREKGEAWNWVVTPGLGGSGAFADDPPSSQNILVQGGLTSLLSYQGSCFTLSMGNQISAYHTVNKTGAYDFTTDIDQQILRNGLKLSVPFGGRWVAEAYGIHTQFLEPGYLDYYYTFGGSLGYHMSGSKKNSYVKIGAYGELGDQGYRAAHLHVGTGWKF